MKKYTKRLLAFLLAAAMVVTGVPMSAKEVKAEGEPKSIVLDFSHPTSGARFESTDAETGEVVATYGELDVINKLDASLTPKLSTSLAGSNWRLNADRTFPTPVEGTDYYAKRTDTTPGMDYMRWASSTSNWSGNMRAVLYFAKDVTLGFDFDVTADMAGEYFVDVVYYNPSSPQQFNLKVNDIVLENVLSGAIQNGAPASGSEKRDNVVRHANTVQLLEGVNTCDIIASSNGYNKETGILGVVFTEYVKPEYAAANFALDAEYTTESEAITLATTAVNEYGIDITEDITVEYASSNPNVASVEGNVLSFVGGGVATISAAVYYDGALKETISRDIKVLNILTANFTRATQGAYCVTDGTTGAIHTEAEESSRSYLITPEFGADNWIVNTDMCVPGLDETGMIPNCTEDTTGIRLFKWGSTKGTWGDRLTRTVMYLYGGATFAIDVEIPCDGYYKAELVYVDNSAPRNLDVAFNPGTDYASSLSFVRPAGDETKLDTVIGLVNESGFAGTVFLPAGTNTITITNPQSKIGNETMVRGIVLTEYVPAEYASANFALDANYVSGAEPVLLTTTAVDVNGNDVSGEITVEYASSNPEVALVEGNVLTFVGGGAATITAAVSYLGQYKETLSAEIKVQNIITLDFGVPTSGARFVTTDAETGEQVETVSGMDVTSKLDGTLRPYLTVDLAGENWALNADRTKPAVVEGTNYYPKRVAKDVLGEDGETVVTPAAPGMDYVRWGNAKTNWSGHHRSAIVFAKDTTLAFDFESVAAGAYYVDVVYYDYSSPNQFDVQVNDTLLTNVLDGTVMNDLGVDSEGVAIVPPNSEKEVVRRQATPVVLNKGANTVDIIGNSRTYNNETYIVGVVFTQYFPTAFGSANFDLDAEYEYGAEPVALATTAVDVNGEDVTNAITVEYASSNPSVAAVEDGVLSFVAGGTATITATVSYFGEEVATLSDTIKVLVPGTFTVDMTKVDPASFLVVTDDKGTSRYYVGPETKGLESEGQTWRVNAETSNPDTINGSGVRAWYSAKTGVTDYIKIMTAGRTWALDFDVTEAGAYDVFANILNEEKGGYTKVWVNGTALGVVDTAKGTPTNQALLTANLVEGTNTIAFQAYDFSTGTNMYFALKSIEFVPSVGEAKVATGFEGGLDITEYDMINVDEEGKVIKGQAFADITATGGVTVFADYSSSEVGKEEPVIGVNRHGEVTPYRAGEATVIISAPGKEDIVIPVVVADSRPRYTVTWMVGDEAIEVDPDVLAGAAVSFDGDAPSKEATAQYTYEFAGWADAEGNAPIEKVVDADLTYYAVFTETVNSYTVKFIVDGEVVSEEVYEYGAMPVVPEVKDYEEADKIYTFLGWDAEVSAVTGEATYTAVFEEAVQNYTIAFADEDGTILEEVTVAPGEVPVWTVTPEKAPTAEFSYTFIGWDKEVVAATGSETYTAVYEATVNKYTVTWMNFDATVLATETYEYGATPEYKGDAPVYGEYTFTGWSPAVSAVKGDATYTAQFEMSGKSIEWFDEDGDGVAETGYYYVDGAVKKGAGLVEVDGYLYWVLSTGKISVSTYRTLKESQTKGLIEPGTYYFFANGVLASNEVKLEGEIRWTEEGGKTVGYYYVQNEICKDVGLVEVYNEEAGESCWYCVLYSGKVKKNYVADGKRVSQTIKAAKLNKYTGPEAVYTFFEDGVMYDPLATESGIVKYDATGKPWYYVDGHIRKDAGLVYVQRGDMAGNYIFVTFSGTLKKGTQSIKEKTCNGHTEFIGTQRFDSTTGAMIIKK